MLPLLALVFQAQAPDIAARTRSSCTRGVDFRALVVPETVYVGQQATYQLGVFIDQETRSRLRRNPEFLPPESRSMLSYDLPDRGIVTGAFGGQPCEAHVFRRALFPLTPGRYTIPPARLSYSIPQSPSFFSREESFTLRSEGVTLVSIDPPSAGRPADWAGAVGSWRTSARVDSVRPRAGDPIVLTLRVEGQGNVTLLPRPALSIRWGTVVAADERVRVDSTPSALRGSKEFDWLLTPSAAGVQRIGPIRFVYFNPGSRQYEVAQTLPLTVRVAPGDVLSSDVAPPPDDAVPPQLLHSAHDDDAPSPLGDAPWLRALMGLAPLAALGTWLIRRPRRLPRAPTPMERLRAAQRNVAGATPSDVRRLLLEGLRARTHLDEAALAHPGAWSRALRLKGVSGEGARDVEQLMDELDANAFGQSGAAPRDAVTRALALLERVDAEARTGERTPIPRSVAVAARTITALLLCALGPTARAQRQGAQGAREAFSLGSTAYAGADFLRAERHFQDAARLAPRSSAAWANAGFAAWAAHDTAVAVVGWQRALRLDPLATGIRPQLMRVRAPQDAGLARVLALPPRLPSLIAALLWLAGWALVASRCWRRQRALPIAVATLAIAGTTALFARQFENRLEGRALVVITDPAGLRAVPALGAQGGVVPLVGEVARVVDRKGVWVQLWLDGDRQGWIATERTAALGRD